MNSISNSTRKPTCVADALGLGRLSDGEPAMDPDLLRQLYRHARDEDGERVIFLDNLTFARGWINLDSPAAARLISAFVPLDDADNLKQARRNAQANLEAQAWNDILNIELPPIIAKVKIHGAKWGLRFQSAEAAMRGREIINEELPPISSDGRESVAQATAGSTSPVEKQTASATGPCAAADALRKGGLPS
jgi:hypothetical protein